MDKPEGKLNFIECDISAEAGWYITIGGTDLNDLIKARRYIQAFINK